MRKILSKFTLNAVLNFGNWRSEIMKKRQNFQKKLILCQVKNIFEFFKNFFILKQSDRNFFLF